ncbi:hypothetical protein JZK55_12800 [Dissulfurispira thermophila]|uniref:Uncharacterized protein n=1 Tax=Dissulfurispira thermophila TaxID=2715679 RepID=A0A7G1H174_9BACT|nr:DUF2301 domain-containing membrane protein [Dissulfurispira thermophila]BCB96358.1 hypothetical protein JZK55_12800 [Dissulfurispira thermophila]
MEQWPTLEEQIEQAGIYYPRKYDITYRVGYILQSIGALGFVILYALESRLQTIPLIIFESGIALSSVFLLVWKAEIKRFILRMTFVGIALQISSIFINSINGFYAEKMFLLGLGFALVGGAGLVGKEAYCFRFNEGWLLLMIYPLAVIPNLFGFASYSYNLIVSAVIAVLQISFLRRKLSQPLLKKCEGNVCGLPETKQR